MIPAMAIAQEKPHLSAEQYLAIEREAETKSELFHGELYAMSGASYAHNVITANLTAALHAALQGGPCRVVASDLRVKDELADSYTYPDLVVTCGEPRFEDRHFDTLLNPIVLIEVLSRSTEGHDRGRKFAAFRRIPSLREVVFVTQDSPLTERFSLHESGDWLLHAAEGVGAELSLMSLGVRVPLAQIYDGVLPAA